MSKAIRRARSLPPYLLVCVLVVTELVTSSGAYSKMCGEILLTATLRFSFRNGVQHSTVGSHRHRKYRRVTHYAARAITCNTLEQYTQ
jgi:hypothetical protein